MTKNMFTQSEIDRCDLLDVIQIEKISVSGRHGVSDTERAACLPLEVDVYLQVDLRQAELSDDLAHTVNYSSIRKRVVELVEQTSCKLLERLAGIVLGELFKDHKIVAARIKISKPQRLDGATPCVNIVRINPNL